ncbi:MAG: hypothetical protein M9942_06975 [Microthrixaceae bacterium]|nr:hypothetical protein [Microthrixaceae bacterium]
MDTSDSPAVPARPVRARRRAGVPGVAVSPRRVLAMCAAVLVCAAVTLGSGAPAGAGEPSGLPQLGTDPTASASEPVPTAMTGVVDRRPTRDGPLAVVLLAANLMMLTGGGWLLWRRCSSAAPDH